MNKTLVIIPTYNEADNISKLVDALFGLGVGLDILVVDDGTDATGEIIQEKQKLHSNLYLIKRTSKSGRGTAVLEGFRFALGRGYNRIAEMDADFSHDPNEFPKLLAVSGDNVLVIGSRYLRDSRIVNWPLRRRIFSKFANIYANTILGIGIHDYTNGYRIYGGEALRKLDMSAIKCKGYIVLSEISYQLFKKGVTFKEVSIVFVNRSRGASNFSLKEIIEAFTSVLKIKFNYKK